jgi:magnesium-transporting ATPase (P-type)
LDERFTPRPVARWYMLAAVASLLFMALGCAVYAMHIYTDPATLPLDQRAMFEAEPRWVTTALGIAAAVGIAGAIMLLLRRKGAESLLLVSLVCALVWCVGLFATPRLRDLLSTNDIAIVIAAMALSWTIYGFARHSRQRGWLH